MTRPPQNRILLGLGVGLLAAVAAGYGLHARPTPAQAGTAEAPPAGPRRTHSPAAASVELPEAMRGRVPTLQAGTRPFVQEERAVGNMDVNEDASVQVLAPYQGRILKVHVALGQDVRQGDPLFTIDSPDLMQAESTLIQAAGVLQLTGRTLARARGLYGQQGVSQHDLEQAISDQQTAEGALNAARDTLRLFGKTAADADRVIASRRVDGRLLVASPVDGRVTARNAQPGLFVQPGSTPAPVVVTDLSTLWMMAYVPEASVPRFREGQPLAATVSAWPGEEFRGEVRVVGSLVDPTTRRVLLRSEIQDPQHRLRSGMFAEFRVTVAPPVESPALPENAVAREGDGTRVAWVTTDGGMRFERREVRTGLQQGGFFQILEGLSPGEVVAADRSVFLSNALVAAVR